MKVYLIVNLSRSPFGLLWTGWDQCFFSKEKAQKKCDELNHINPPNWQLFEMELDEENKDTEHKEKHDESAYDPSQPYFRED
jgi:hypothetical protein